MRFKNRNINVLLAAVCLASCGAQPIVHYQNMDAAAFEQASSSNMSPQQACEAASVAIARGHKTGLQFYSPLHLQHAIDNLEEGQGLIKVRETQTHGAKKCYKSAKFIKNGMAIKSKVGITLKNSLNELRLLKRVDVKNKYSDDIKDFADDVKDLVKLIEGDKISEAIQGQTELLREMLDLEVEIITDIHLSPVEDMLEKA